MCRRLAATEIILPSTGRRQLEAVAAVPARTGITAAPEAQAAIVDQLLRLAGRAARERREIAAGAMADFPARIIQAAVVAALAAQE
jgi:hypothetical protein